MVASAELYSFIQVLVTDQMLIKHLLLFFSIKKKRKKKRGLGKLIFGNICCLFDYFCFSFCHECCCCLLQIYHSVSANAALVQVCRGELGTFGRKIYIRDSGCATTQKLCSFSHPHPHATGRGHRPLDETVAAAECHKRSFIVHMKACLSDGKEFTENFAENFAVRSAVSVAVSCLWSKTVTWFIRRRTDANKRMQSSAFCDPTTCACCFSGISNISRAMLLLAVFIKA